MTIIHAGQLLAVPGQAVLEKQRILVSNGEIQKVVAGYLRVADLDGDDAEVRVLDLTRYFVLPGLMDLHVHITMEPRPQEHLRVVTESDADLALTGAQHAKITLEAGFTTIVDCIVLKSSKWWARWPSATVQTSAPGQYEISLEKVLTL